ncbi:hypothetical protein FZI85_07680 [Mycobacterium sp. CBMA293]|uniref:hypothetical protein n=1 Tax=unclassified Mycolicibacterium TaxID=2636767 RepID=UPI0012DC4FD4|nr:MULTISPECIES: hypothetical protein [unclassified Mycolicibacterium]MUL45448.1 hypothetical protein [Mycolicibacterium sp. CBMA 360]MUL56969.1 hypothetical protein [Mycolicibacterium sp. CBMA 335]MUL70009.1 hypothetical protein [Mycolicibacterium sp. CBMA 311]MUL92057.1 hypothetical protein [Mycolicibacterium sp. CBMA 230]MUM05796.1 hypothetical protein [Mycolicibacterium sp. CBMA 213]
MSRSDRLWLNPIVAICAVIGVIAGGIAGALFPISTTYRATAQIAMVPGPGLTTAESSAYWEILTHGQVSRTAAAVFSDPRWTAGAVSAAGVSASDLKLTADAVPDTTMVSITADAPTRHAADAAVEHLIENAMPEVSAVSAPFHVRVVSPPDGGTAVATSRTQVILAGVVGGLVIGSALGIGLAWRRTRER